ncbi:MAG: dTDP-4-dehydrorhamnose reductase [Streptosporangiaceae bacterium]
MTRWLVTGSAGKLGHDLVTALAAMPAAEVAAPRRRDLDITDGEAVRGAVEGCDIVVNCAAWTDVDGAEADESGAFQVNAVGPANVAAACAKAGAALVQVSTDYVFAGDASEPYRADAPVQPVNAYGRSKAAGEAAVLEILPDLGYIVRTAWLYGEHGPSFVASILRAAAERETLDVVSDATGQPTWSYPLALQIASLGSAALTGRARPGIYHGTASGSTTWYGLACAVFEQSGLCSHRIRPVTSENFARPARRPAFSVLDHSSWAQAGMKPMADWRHMLTDALGRPYFAELREGLR